MSDFIRVCKTTDIPDPGKAVFEVQDVFVVVFHVEGKFSALNDCCTHDGGPLGEGELEGLEIACPRHGARFDIRSGRAFHARDRDTQTYEVKVEGEEVWIKVGE